MNNLSENKPNAKQLHLDAQQENMLAMYRTADASERAAIIRQIDGFLPTLAGDEKTFWLSFRHKLERLSETDEFQSRRDFLRRLGFAIFAIPVIAGAKVSPDAHDELRRLLGDFVQIYRDSPPVERAQHITDFQNLSLSPSGKEWISNFLNKLTEVYE